MGSVHQERHERTTEGLGRPFTLTTRRGCESAVEQTRGYRVHLMWRGLQSAGAYAELAAKYVVMG